MSSITHGASRGGKTTPTYNSWKLMKSRCLNKTNQDYKHYGGRGITICDRWLEGFQNFLTDMGEKPKGLSIERKDNNGNYEPDNCVWATQQEQMKNTRRNVYLTYRGQTMHLSAWARYVGLPEKTLWYRHSQGWSAEEMFYRPQGRWNWDEKKVYLIYSGEELSIAGWAKRIGIDISTIHRRIKNGLPIEKILSKKNLRWDVACLNP